MSDKDDYADKIEWSIRVPIFRNSIILKQLGIAIGIPFGLLIMFLILSSNGENRIYAFYALGFIGGLFLLTYLLIMLMYGGKYDATFVVDSRGVLCYTQEKQARKNRILNRLTVVLGLLSGKPTAAGAGILAGTKQSVFLKWNNITKVKYVPKQNVILLRGGLTENIAVFCTEDNYYRVVDMINGKIKG